MGHTRHKDNGAVRNGSSHGIWYCDSILTPEDIRKLEGYISDKWGFNIDPPPLMIGQDHRISDEGTRDKD